VDDERPSGVEPDMLVDPAAAAIGKNPMRGYQNGLPPIRVQAQRTRMAARQQLDAMRRPSLITYPTKLAKAFDFLPKIKYGRSHGFPVTEAFVTAWKHVFGSDDFTPSAIRAAARNNDPRLAEVRRIYTESDGAELERAPHRRALGRALGGPGAPFNQ
jgi:hypothetical protein